MVWETFELWMLGFRTRARERRSKMVKSLSSGELGQNPRSPVGGRALLPNEVHLIPIPIIHSELGMST